MSTSQETEELRRRLKWLLFFRLLVAILCIGIILISAAGDRALQERLGAPYYLLVFVCFLNLPYLLLLRRVRQLRRFAAFQLVTDLLLVSALIYLTGGVQSNFSVFYFMLVLAASSILSLRASLLVASSSTALLALVTMVYLVCGDLEIRPWLVPEASWNIWRERLVGGFAYHLAFLVAQAVAYHLVAVLSGSLASRLRRVRIMTGEILQNMSEGVITLDQQGRIAYLNPRAAELLGLDPSPGVSGQHFWSVFPTVISDRLGQVLRGRRALSFEVQLPSSSGERPLMLSTSVLGNRKGKFRGLNVLIGDMSERRRMAEAMKRINRLEALSEAAASIAHEVRNPLASIRGSAQALSESSALPDNVDRKLLHLIVSESDRINNIVTDFLLFTRVRKPNLASCDLQTILDDVVLLLKNHPLGTEAQIELHVETPFVVTADAELLRRAFLNLGLNSLEAMQDMPNEKCLHIHAYTAPAGKSGGDSPGDGLVVDFLDHGPGIDSADKGKIFEPFFTRKASGTGLGLAIVSRIVEVHGGTITVDNLPQGGCRFSLKLPQHVGQPSPSAGSISS